MNQTDLIYLATGVGVLCLFAIIAIVSASKRPVYQKKGQLLLLNEQRFLTAALQALPPDTLLTFKVRLLDVLTSRNERNNKSLNDELRDYVVDFVLVDRYTTTPKLCIEITMDGRDARANAMIGTALRKCGIPHLKLPLVRFYDPIRLRQLFLNAINETMVK